MKIENLSQELKEKVKQLLESAPADQKADAIMQSIEMIEEAAHSYHHRVSEFFENYASVILTWQMETEVDVNGTA